MAGTKAGGLKCAQKNLARDPDFYVKIGAIGGSRGNTGGFAGNPELARRAGAIGGRKSRRGSNKPKIAVEVVEKPKSFWQRLVGAR